ncbi:nucleoside kinase [Pectinatus frisingensis]|jgi:uridine kinase|uniref:nucleoside kinase n=1 Tax=Pectinatus frisingensis TaxID=865 RepID=UPI0015F66930|nr:nucleoside kinase [Pectinatus frisingensis]
MTTANINAKLVDLINLEKDRHTAPITAVKINNNLKDLQTPFDGDPKLELIDMNSSDGVKIYRRSVLFLLMTSVKKLFPDASVIVEHSVNNGMYCKILPVKLVTPENIKKITLQMQSLIKENIPIIKKFWCKKDVINLFKKNGQYAKVALIESLKQDIVSIYFCDEYYDYLYGPMLPETKSLGLFAIDHYPPGIIIRTPSLSNPLAVPPQENQNKLASLLSEADDWANILRCDYVSNLNQYITTGKSGDLIRISEALHEKKIAQIADTIVNSPNHPRVIFIAGPSSSGKTTFAQRLRVQLLVNGMQPVSLSMDNYFLDRDQTPLNEKGEYDFESFTAIDKTLLIDQILSLLSGEEVEIPTYNFFSGQKEWTGNKIHLPANHPIIVEGIHGLNPNLTKSLPKDKIYKIYISALTQLGIDKHNNIPTTVARLIRRIVRDYQFRGSSALKTIKQWPDVRTGEENNIFPYQEHADIMFNSALIYELAVLKKYAYPLLEKISNEVPEYSISRQLLDFLNYFETINNEDIIPNNSILREFIGNSCFF